MINAAIQVKLTDIFGEVGGFQNIDHSQRNFRTWLSGFEHCQTPGG
jgi:hypothetical protein